MQVRSEEERQSGSSSGCAGRLRVHMPAWSSDLSCRTSLWPSLGRLLCARVMSIEHDAFFSFYRPQVALPIKTGGEVLGVPMSIGKHRRGRPGKAGVDYQGHTGRRVQRRGALCALFCLSSAFFFFARRARGSDGAFGPGARACGPRRGPDRGAVRMAPGVRPCIRRSFTRPLLALFSACVPHRPSCCNQLPTLLDLS